MLILAAVNSLINAWGGSDNCPNNKRQISNIRRVVNLSCQIFTLIASRMSVSRILKTAKIINFGIMRTVNSDLNLVRQSTPVKNKTAQWNEDDIASLRLLKINVRCPTDL